MIEIETQPPSAWADARVGALPLLRHENGTDVRDVDDWLQRRDALRARWLEYLGPDPFPDLHNEVREEAIEEHPADGPHDPHGPLRGRCVRLRTAPAYDELCYLMWPVEAEREPRPAVLVF